MRRSPSRRRAPTALELRATRPLNVEALEGRCLLTTSSLSAAAISSSPDDAGRLYNPTDILVSFNSNVTKPTALPGSSIGAALPGMPGVYEIDLSPSLSVPDALSAYLADPDVAEAQPDYGIQISGGSVVVPNDPNFNSQWYLNNTGQSGGAPGADINAPGAWAVTTGNTTTVVAVIDTGVDYDQPDLYGNIWINQAEIPPSRLANLVDYQHAGRITFWDLNYTAPNGSHPNQGQFKITDVNGDGIIDAGDLLAPMQKNAQGQDTGWGGWADGISEDGDTSHVDDIIGWNFVNNNNNPMDENGHGTAVAGVIGAMGNNGIGVAGIAWNVEIMPVQFLDASGSGYTSAAIEAIDYAVQHGAYVLNNSWAGGSYDPALLSAIQYTQQAGDIFVAAAGNNSANLDTSPVYPASYLLSNMITVAATDQYDNLASFSNYGAHSVDLAAPGVDILTTTPNKTYSWYSGTSFSAPQVTGVVALIHDQHPTWTYEQVINQILDTVDPLPSLQGKTISGGRLDAAAALGNPNARLAPATGPSDATFLDQLYENLLGRAIDPAGLSYWSHLLQTGTSRAQVAQALWQSPEHRTDEVDSYFSMFLHRSPDSAGLSYWVGQFLAGASETQVMSGFLTSPEYTSLHSDDASFITGLYEDVLGRAPDSAGWSFWMQLLQQMGRNAVATAFLNSSESYWQIVNTDYALFLRRPTDPSGGSYWVSLLTTGQVNIEDVGIAMLSSNEYYNKS